MSVRRLLLSGFVLMTLVWAQSPPLMPHVEGESFTGRKVVLPDAVVGHVAVLVFGFSKKSKDHTSTWADKIHAEFGTQAGFELYQLPVLEDVPRFIRGMVVSSIQKGVRQDMRDHFVPVLQGEAELKKLVGYRDPDDAYLVVLNREGKIVSQTHAALSEVAYNQLSREIQSLLDER